MKIPFFNSEQYADPTAYEALTNIEIKKSRLRAYRPLVYICSPFSGDIAGNTANARRYCRFAVREGYIPQAVHLFFTQFLNDADPDERELGMFFGNVIMSKCSEVWVFGDYISSGMEAEIKRAKVKKYTIRYFSTECKEVKDHA